MTCVIFCQLCQLNLQHTGRSEYFFDFNKPFTIHDDVEVLKQMGLTWGLEQGMITDAQHEEARRMIPSELVSVLDDMVAYYRAHPAPMPGGHLSTPIMQPQPPLPADVSQGAPVPTPVTAPAGPGLLPPAMIPTQYPPEASPFPTASMLPPAASHLPSSVTPATSMPASNATPQG